MIEQLRSQTDIRERLAELSDAELEQLLYDWPSWARPNQLAPALATNGLPWATWLVLAGRGYGKTRVGAEKVREWKRQGYQRVNFIAPTADDLRDVLIEGESGIMAVCPPNERPVYRVSKRRLEWPDGSLSLLFSAQEPERLRGKQSDKLWCLTGDALVLMKDGSTKPLHCVDVGDRVATRCGSRRVTASMLTKRKAEILQLTTVGGRVIMGTADHPVWVEGRGFIRLDSIVAGMRVCVTSASSMTAISGTSKRIKGITCASFTSIARCGKRSAGLSRQAMKFTTWTRTKITTHWITLNSSQRKLTAAVTAIDSATLKLKSLLSQALLGFGRSTDWHDCSANYTVPHVSSLTRAPRSIHPGFAPNRALIGRGLEDSLATSGHASTAGMATNPSSAPKGSAAASAIAEHVKPGRHYWLNGRWRALVAAIRSRVDAAMPGFALGNAPKTTTETIASVKRLAKREDVYDIAVEGAHEFFANGILVHNCDEVAAWRYQQECWDQAMFGLRLGNDPQVVATTTPKPTKLIRELLKDPTTAVTRGTTYDNKANLAPTFYTKIITKYEGTRLGRQELNAEVLDDNPGALFKRSDIEAGRITLAQQPVLVRTVVAIDPAVTSNEDSDETGMITVGIDRRDPPHFYVVEDTSDIYTPDGWAKMAVKVYHQREADRVVGEVNNGGDMIEATLRHQDQNVSYKSVRATKGKAIRAEPVAALYEQRRVHHVGNFAELEDQMVEWNPSADDNSPDRMDALVWAITELAGGWDEWAGLLRHYQNEGETEAKKQPEPQQPVPKADGVHPAPPPPAPAKPGPVKAYERAIAAMVPQRLCAKCTLPIKEQDSVSTDGFQEWHEACNKPSWAS